MRKITCDEWVNIRGGEGVPSGFGDETLYAPDDDGTYTLYEFADESNIHRGWQWVKED